MKNKLVNQVMHRGAVTCTLDTFLHQVIRLMKGKGVHAILVADKGKALGIVSHMDIIRQYGKDLSRLRVQDVMSDQLVFIGPQDTIEKAIELILKHNVHRLPVTDGKDLLGIVSTSDILRDMQESSFGFVQV